MTEIPDDAVESAPPHTRAERVEIRKRQAFDAMRRIEEQIEDAE